MPWAPGARLVVALDAAIRRAPGGPLVAPGERVLVGVSGGPDSTALAYALSAASARFGRGWVLVLAHLHHGLRGEAADRDRDFAREAARRIGAGWVERRADIEADRRARGGSVEEAGRRLRYELFLEAARAERCAKVATAHHRDDQAETVLLRAIRGTGVRGLAGIPLRRPLGDGAGAVEVVRPLLGFPREQLLRYLSEIGVEAREDASNQAVTYARNRIRHEGLPLLREIHPGAIPALVRLAGAACEAEEVLDALVAARLATLTDPATVPLALLRADPPPLAALVLARAAERVLGRPLLASHRALLRRLVLAPGAGGLVHLPGGASARRGYEAIAIDARPRAGGAAGEPGEGSVQAPAAEFPVASGGRTEVPALGVAVTVRRLEAGAPSAAAPGSAPRALLSASAIEGRPLALRLPRPGDRISPVGMSGTKKLQDLFVDAKMPRADRPWSLLLTAGGEIAWVVGLRVDRRYAGEDILVEVSPLGDAPS